MKLRPNVAAIIRNDAGEILIGERADMPGAWQFPQGGMAKGETREQAVQRELLEELSLSPGKYCIEECRGPYEYVFPANRKKKGYSGQSQHYFLARFIGKPDDIRVETASPEFRATRWIVPNDFRLEWLPKFKQEVYRAVLRDFFGVER